MIGIRLATLLGLMTVITTLTTAHATPVPGPASGTLADHACAISSSERAFRMTAAADAFESTVGDLNRARRALDIYSEQLQVWNRTARAQTVLAITGTIATASVFALPMVMGVGTATGLEIGLNSVSAYVWLSTRFYTVFQGGDQSHAQDPDFLLQRQLSELTSKNLSLDDSHGFLSQVSCESCSLDSSAIEKALQDLKAWSDYKAKKFGAEPNLFFNPMSSYYREKTAQLHLPEAAAYTTLLTLKKNYLRALLKVLRHDESICASKRVKSIRHFDLAGN